MQQTVESSFVSSIFVLMSIASAISMVRAFLRVGLRPSPGGTES